MTKWARRAICLFTFAMGFSVAAEATTHPAATCNVSDVQTQINAASSGDTVTIPAGTCTWTTGVTWTAPPNVTLQGAGSQSVVGGGDATVVIDNINRSSFDAGALNITTNPSGTFRLTGITFQGSGNSSAVTFNGSLRINGSSQQFRMDHVHLNLVQAIGMDIDGQIYGVIDHCLIDQPAGSTNNGVRIGAYSWGGNSFGDGSWAASSNFGTSQFLFLENNTINNGAFNDCNNGGRFVIRNNTFNNSTIQGHEMEQRATGCRAYEVYNNTFIGSPSNPPSGLAFFRTGTGLFWGNTSTNYQYFMQFYNDRSDTNHPQAAPPNGWGYCGTAIGPSPWDQNTDASGYACFEQIGRGKGDLLANDFPNAIDTVTGSAAWPHQALEPVYLWKNSYTAPQNYTYHFIGASGVIQQGRDYYTDDSGSTGVGSGLLSARPTTCTSNVAYWATDTNTLYQCSAPNTWTPYYTPYTYPHPLVYGATQPSGPAWSGIIDPSRAVDWSSVGSPAVAASKGWTQCGATIAAGASAATINAAISACAANHYVQLGAGTFNLSTGITFGQKNNVKLVGAGADQTQLIFSGTNSCLGFNAGICMASSDLNYVLNQSNIANWTASYLAGSTSIVLDNKTNLSVGSAILLDQLDDTTDNGDIFVCYQSNGTQNCSTNGDNGGFARANRGQQQIVTVTSISGTGPYTIGITPAIYMPNWTSSKTPQAWWATSPVQNMGIENLSVDYTAAEPSQGNGVGVEMFNCSGCWVKGIRSISPGRSHVQAQVSTNITVQDSYFFLTAGHTSVSYGVESAGASAVLIQNNVFQQVTEPMSLNGSCSGCVEGYNFDIDDIYGSSPYNWRMASSLPHAVGVSHVLMEGNQGSGLEGDIIHGSHHFITAFRNNWNGYQKNNGINPTGNIGPVILMALNRFFNFIGNVLGTTAGPYNGYQTSTAIFSLGGSESSTYTVPADSNVGRTLMRWGNYDTVTGAVRWCGNSSDPGWSTTCAGTSEVPSAITAYANPVPASTALPASFYLSSQPSWWPAGKHWPPIGPDVSGGNIANLGGHAYTIPAADCYANIMGGPADGTGSVLTFNAAACYGTAPATSPCDVNGDGSTNILDVQADVNAALGTIACAPNYDLNKDNQCNIIDVQRVVNAALGGACVSP